MTPQKYVNLVSDFLKANDKLIETDPIKIRGAMIDEYDNIIKNLHNLINTFGVKKHPRTELPTVDVSWPNLRIAVERALLYHLKNILSEVLGNHEESLQESENIGPGDLEKRQNLSKTVNDANSKEIENAHLYLDDNAFTPDGIALTEASNDLLDYKTAAPSFQL